MSKFTDIQSVSPKTTPFHINFNTMAVIQTEASDFYEDILAIYVHVKLDEGTEKYFIDWGNEIQEKIITLFSLYNIRINDDDIEITVGEGGFWAKIKPKLKSSFQTITLLLTLYNQTNVAIRDFPENYEHLSQMAGQVVQVVTNGKELITSGVWKDKEMLKLFIEKYHKEDNSQRSQDEGPVSAQ